METFKLNLTSLQNKIFRFLCINAGKNFNLSEIARNLKVSPTAVAKALVNLKKEEIVLVKENSYMNLLSIELNLENQRVMELKRVENLSMIYESGIISFLSEHLPGTTIILFGSYSRGDDLFNSDIDLAIIGKTKSYFLKLTKIGKKLGAVIPMESSLKKGDKVEIKRVDYLSQFEKILKKKITLNFYNNLNHMDKNLRNNLLNGVVLSGALEL